MESGMSPIPKSVLQEKIIQTALSQEHLAGVIDGKDGLAFRTTKPASFCCLELFRTDWALEYLWEHICRSFFTVSAEKIHRLIQIILDIEKL